MTNWICANFASSLWCFVCRCVPSPPLPLSYSLLFFLIPSLHPSHHFSSLSSPLFLSSSIRLLLSFFLASPLTSIRPIPPPSLLSFHFSLHQHICLFDILRKDFVSYPLTGDISRNVTFVKITINAVCTYECNRQTFLVWHLR